MGLVAAGYRDALVVLADLLADRFAAGPRRGGAALGHSGQDAAALMLRLKLTLTDGDRDPDAAAECMARDGEALAGQIAALRGVVPAPRRRGHARRRGPGPGRVASAGGVRTCSATGWSGEPTPTPAGCCWWRSRRSGCRRRSITWSATGRRGRSAVGRGGDRGAGDLPPRRRDAGEAGGAGGGPGGTTVRAAFERVFGAGHRKTEEADQSERTLAHRIEAGAQPAATRPAPDAAGGPRGRWRN